MCSHAKDIFTIFKIETPMHVYDFGVAIYYLPTVSV